VAVILYKHAKYVCFLIKCSTATHIEHPSSLNWTFIAMLKLRQML